MLAQLPRILSCVVHALTCCGPSCRFLPTCSEYAEEVIRRCGVFHGSVLTIQRLLRCHPWGEAGLDLPPTGIRQREP